MKKAVLTLLLISLIFTLTSCGNGEGESTETSFNNPDYPSFGIENVEAEAGDSDVIVYVSIKDNPGFLTMAMNIEYDSDVMSLVKVENGKDYADYNFVPPKNKTSGCTISWFRVEPADEIKDGNLAVLHFVIPQNAKRGEFQIKASRASNGGVVDNNKNILVVNNAVGYIKIK